MMTVVVGAELVTGLSLIGAYSQGRQACRRLTVKMGRIPHNTAFKGRGDWLRDSAGTH